MQLVQANDSSLCSHLDIKTMYGMRRQDILNTENVLPKDKYLYKNIAIVLILSLIHVLSYSVCLSEQQINQDIAESIAKVCFGEFLNEEQFSTQYQEYCEFFNLNKIGIEDCYYYTSLCFLASLNC